MLFFLSGVSQTERFCEAKSSELHYQSDSGPPEASQCDPTSGRMDAGARGGKHGELRDNAL